MKKFNEIVLWSMTYTMFYRGKNNKKEFLLQTVDLVLVKYLNENHKQ